MYVKVSNPGILPEGFVGHIDFFEDSESPWGICYEHKLFVFGDTVDQVRERMARSLEHQLEGAIAASLLQMKIFKLSEEDWQSIEQADELDAYVVVKSGTGSAREQAKPAIYKAGVHRSEASKKAA